MRNALGICSRGSGEGFSVEKTTHSVAVASANRSTRGSEAMGSGRQSRRAQAAAAGLQLMTVPPAGTTRSSSSPTSRLASAITCRTDSAVVPAHRR